MKTQDATGKALDLAINSLLNSSQAGTTGKLDLGLVTQNGVKTTAAAFDGLFNASKAGLTGQADVGVKVQDGLSKALDFANSSIFNLNKDGAAGQTALDV
ncbi:hypothetical protein, partial [Pseudomonas sp. NBRC 111135]